MSSTKIQVNTGEVIDVTLLLSKLPEEEKNQVAMLVDTINSLTDMLAKVPALHGIGRIMLEDQQTNEFVERGLSYLFELFNADYDNLMETCLEDMDVDVDEVYEIFETLGYVKEEE